MAGCNDICQNKEMIELILQTIQENCNSFPSMKPTQWTIREIPSNCYSLESETTKCRSKSPKRNVWNWFSRFKKQKQKEIKPYYWYYESSTTRSEMTDKSSDIKCANKVTARESSNVRECQLSDICTNSKISPSPSDNYEHKFRFSRLEKHFKNKLPKKSEKKISTSNAYCIPSHRRLAALIWLNRRLEQHRKETPSINQKNVKKSGPMPVVKCKPCKSNINKHFYSCKPNELYPGILNCRKLPKKLPKLFLLSQSNEKSEFLMRVNHAKTIGYYYSRWQIVMWTEAEFSTNNYKCNKTTSIESFREIFLANTSKTSIDRLNDKMDKAVRDQCLGIPVTRRLNSLNLLKPSTCKLTQVNPQFPIGYNENVILNSESATQYKFESEFLQEICEKPKTCENKNNKSLEYQNKHEKNKISKSFTKMIACRNDQTPRPFQLKQIKSTCDMRKHERNTDKIQVHIESLYTDQSEIIIYEDDVTNKKTSEEINLSRVENTDRNCEESVKSLVNLELKHLIPSLQLIRKNKVMPELNKSDNEIESDLSGIYLIVNSSCPIHSSLKNVILRDSDGLRIEESDDHDFIIPLEMISLGEAVKQQKREISGGIVKKFESENMTSLDESESPLSLSSGLY